MRCPRCRRAALARAAVYCASCGHQLRPEIEPVELVEPVEPDASSDAGATADRSAATRSAGRARRKLIVGAATSLVAGAIILVATSGTDRQVAPSSRSTIVVGTTTGTVAFRPPTVIGDGRPLLGEQTGLSILLADYDGNLEHLDLDTGEVRSTRFATRPGQESSWWFLTDDGMVSTSAAGVVLRGLDGTERTLAPPPANEGTTFAPAGRGQIWALTSTESASTTVRRVDIAAASVVESVSIGDATLVGADDSGRPLLRLADATVWRYGSDERWTNVGAANTRLLGHGVHLDTNCQTPPTCTLEVRRADQPAGYTVTASDAGPPTVVQGGSSNGTLTALARTIGPSTVGPGASGPPPDAAIDVYGPDGARVATFGDVIARYDQNGFGGLTWSADGRWLFWLGLVKVHAWHVGLAGPIDIDLSGLPVPVQHLTVTHAP